MKVFYMGRRFNTRLEIIKSWFKKLLAFLAIISSTVALLYATFMIGAYTYSTNTSTVCAQDRAEKKVEITVKDKLETKVEQLKKEVIAKLKNCESNGFDEDDALIVFDTNKKASVGEFQFQRNTVINYYKKLYGKTITAKEATHIALDTDKASELAMDIIFNDKGLGNWGNCARKHDLYTEVKLINKLK